MGFVLKADVKHYFPSIDHDILIRIINKRIKDERVMLLVKKILKNNESGLPKGMPIGNLTSQLFANVYLDPLDQFVKHELRAQYYIRYLDDFVVLHRSKKKLALMKKEIERFLNQRLHIELHQEKSQIYPFHKGVSFLGFRMFYHCRLPGKSNLRNLDRRMQIFRTYKEAGTMSSERIRQSFEGWTAYAKHGNTYNLRRKLGKRYGDLLDDQRRTMPSDTI